MVLEAGSRLGPYEIVALLGSGGMGDVYRARDPRLDRDVAVKLVRDEVADRGRMRRFEQEARAAGALSHPNVLSVYDVGMHDGAPYVVSELLEGHTLRSRLEGGALPVRKALDYASQIARGLAAAHDKGIVHRDLKPENVFVTDDGRVKLLDFGLAKLTRPDLLRSEATAATAATPTEAGTPVGTVGFMSPEQVRGEQVDHRSDVFSAGAVLYEMLSGRRAFRRETAVDTMNAILKEDPPPLSEGELEIPAGLAAIVDRCLEKRAGERFHTAHDLALALEAVSSETTPASTGPRGLLAAPGLRRAALATLVLMALIAGGLYWSIGRGPAQDVGREVQSVAVLPFENVGGDPASQYLSDGVAESLISELSQLPDLTVMARSTSFRFRGPGIDPRQVGRELGVGAVLAGRVSLRGDRLVIGAELVDVERGAQIWGEQYDTGIGDMFALQKEIARDISRQMRQRLASQDGALATSRRSIDPEAYRLLLLARHELRQPSPEASRRAIEHARRVVERAPDFAPAFAALAEAYHRLGNWAVLPTEEAYREVETAARRALAIDETLAEAHTALAHALTNLDWDWAGAQGEFERAVELSASSAAAHDGYGMHLVMTGSPREGIAHLRRAVELDPLSPERYLWLSSGYYFDRQYDRALEPLRLASELGGRSAWSTGITFRELGLYDESIAAFEGNADHAESTGILGHRGNALARAGRVEEAMACVRALEARFEGGGNGAYEVALIFAGLGRKDDAFQWLERAYTRRDKGLTYLRVDPPLDPLRPDPRFDGLLRRVGLSE